MNQHYGMKIWFYNADLSGFPKNSRVYKYHICRVGFALEGLIRTLLAELTRTLLAGLTGEDLT